jgi:uroporphyrinogen decarboxylase
MIFMNGKELIIKTLRHENTASVPWVPFAGVHAGKLVGATARQILTEGDVLLKALLEVNKLYRPDGQPIMFDLQIEAEILGCELLWAEDNPPSVKSHPLSETNEIPCLCMLPEKSDGRIPLVLDVMRKMKVEVGDTTALYGLTCGPFTLASHLRGTNIFMDMYDDPE